MTKLQPQQPDETCDSGLQVTGTFGREGGGLAVGTSDQISPTPVEALSGRQIILMTALGFVIYHVKSA